MGVHVHYTVPRINTPAHPHTRTPAQVRMGNREVVDEEIRKAVESS